MDKIAQERSRLNKLREKLNLRGLALESAPFASPEFKQLMDDLRITDDRARAIALGQPVGEAAAPEDGLSLKTLLAKAQKNFNRREYMSSLADLGLFHEKLHEISKSLKLFHVSIDAIHEKFLIEGLDDETKESLRKLKKRMASKEEELIKEAGILDFLAKIYQNRSSALKSWEARYPNQVKKIKTSLSSLIQKAKSVFNNLISRFKEMGTARATRKVDSFDEAIKKVIKLYDEYNAKFVEVYAGVKSFMDKIEEKQEEIAESISEPSAKNAPISQVTNIPSTKRYPIEEPKVPSLPSEEDPLADLHISYEKPKSELQFEQGIPVAKPLSPAEIAQFSAQRSQKAQTLVPQFMTTFKPIKNDQEFLSQKPKSNVPPPTLIPELMEKEKISSEPELPSTEKDNPATKQYNQMINSDRQKEQNTIRTGKVPIAHNEFIETLESMGSESPIILKSYIAKYAKSIKNSDVEIYNKLVNIYNAIKNE